jgi:RNA polymerase sigma factor (sigma-70 family)
MDSANTEARPEPISNHELAQTPTTWVGERLGEWQASEVRVAHGFPECRDLDPVQIEDLYQDTAVALLNNDFESEEHLRNALRQGIRHRALNHHRDRRRRTQIVQRHAPAMQRLAESHRADNDPEHAVLAEQDRLIAVEFLSELNPLEQQVFTLAAEGLRYRAIANALDIPTNEARTASRAVERKRQRFQLFYDTGRLCGYRAAIIQALRDGTASDDVARRAHTHLNACPNCRDTQRERASRLAGLLPLPILLRQMLHRIATRAGLGPATATSSTGVLAGTGAIKLAIAAIAATAIAASMTHSGGERELWRPDPPTAAQNEQGDKTLPPSLTTTPKRRRTHAPPRRAAAADEHTRPTRHHDRTAPNPTLRTRPAQQQEGRSLAGDDTPSAQPNLNSGRESSAAAHEFGPEQPAP